MHHAMRTYWGERADEYEWSVYISGKSHWYPLD